MKKPLRVLSYVAGGLILLLLILFLCRQTILDWAIAKATDKLRAKNVTLHIHQSTVKGFAGASLSGISLVPQNGDTLFTCKELYVSLELLPLFRGALRPDEINISDASVRLIRKDGKDNFQWLLKSEKKKDTTVKRIAYAKLCDRAMDILFGYIPVTMEGQNLRLDIQVDQTVASAGIPVISIKNHRFSSEMWMKEKDQVTNFNASGKLDARDRALNLTLNVTDKGKLQLPLLEGLVNAKAGFRSIEVALKQEFYKSGTLALSGKAEIHGLFIDHKKLAPSEVMVNTAGLTFNLQAGEDEVVLDSNSTVYMNGWSSFIFARYNRAEQRLAELKVMAPSFEAQQFFEALPTGMFSTLEGIKVKGKLSYHLHMMVRLDQPDSVLLNSTLKKENFSIVRYGKANLATMNGAFQLPVYDRGGYVRTLDVSESNPYYVTYANIPEKLKFCVLTSEDGSFMWHKGFNEGAFAKSISENLKAGRFKRGGSTISMQLVKNIFLNKNKTVSRKLEEIMIVWLIENQHITSKERMLEVYFNVIEWGPNVYGLGEASEFYFSKKPQELQLNECIFLTSIIPKPKHYKWSFDDQGHLRDYNAGYYNLISGIMLRREQITEAEKAALVPDVELKGRAKDALVIKDTTVVASPEVMEE